MQSLISMNISRFLIIITMIQNPKLNRIQLDEIRKIDIKGNNPTE